MVCGLVWLSWTEPPVAPSICGLVGARLREPSAEPMLEAEWVRDRASRVMLAVGTGRGKETKGG